MKETMNEATVVMAKCRRSKQPFGIRMEKKKDGVWYCTWAFRLSERAAANEGYGGTLVSGETHVTCGWCNMSGECSAAESFDLKGDGY